MKRRKRRWRRRARPRRGPARGSGRARRRARAPRPPPRARPVASRAARAQAANPGAQPPPPSPPRTNITKPSGGPRPVRPRALRRVRWRPPRRRARPRARPRVRARLRRFLRRNEETRRPPQTPGSNARLGTRGFGVCSAGEWQTRRDRRKLGHRARRVSGRRRLARGANPKPAGPGSGRPRRRREPCRREAGSNPASMGANGGANGAAGGASPSSSETTPERSARRAGRPNPARKPPARRSRSLGRTDRAPCRSCRCRGNPKRDVVDKFFFVEKFFFFVEEEGRADAAAPPLSGALNSMKDADLPSRWPPARNLMELATTRT